MKNRYSYSAMRMLLFSILLGAIGNVSLAQATEPPFKEVVKEDFSLWTEGSETTPHNKTEGGSANSYNLNSAIMHQIGWKGNFVYQAGGCAYLKLTDDGVAGHLQTPEMALYGVVKITFRAKLLAGKQSEGKLWIALCDNTQGPVDNKDVDLTTEWQQYEMVSDKATFNDKNIFQLQPLECDMLIDDIVVERKQTTLIPPNALPPLNTSSTSFKARWEASPDAKSYLFSLYYLDMPQEVIPPTTIIEGFDRIKTDDNGKIDTTQPNYPDGWTIDLSSHGSQDVIQTQGNFRSSPLALVFDAVDDSIVSPKTIAPITELSFWVKPTSIEQETDYTYTLLEVSVLSDGKWVAIANLPNMWMQEQGGYYVFNSGVLKSYNIEQVRLKLIQKNSVSFYVDNITYTYGSKPVPYYIHKDKELTATEYEVSQYDTSKEHYYYVCAKDGDAISERTYPTWVDGIRGVKPAVHAASSVSATCYVANWEKIYSAGLYQLNNYKDLTHKPDAPKQEILHETFDNITVGSLEAPVKPDEQVIFLAKGGQTKTDWIAQLPAYAKGMMGVKETAPYSSTAGLVVSPALYLTPDKGAFEVSVKAQSTVNCDTLFVMVMKEYTDKEVNEYMRIPFPEKAGVISSTVPFAAPKDLKTRERIRIGFMSLRGKPFYIDEMAVYQNINEGEHGYAPYQTNFVADNNFYEVKHGLDGQNFVYNVVATRNRIYQDYVSEISDFMSVANPNNTALLEPKVTDGLIVQQIEGGLILSADLDTLLAIYDLSGILICKVPLHAGAPRFTSLDRGVYILHTTEKNYKAIVR